jgi:hypothetical protein
LVFTRWFQLRAFFETTDFRVKSFANGSNQLVGVRRPSTPTYAAKAAVEAGPCERGPEETGFAPGFFEGKARSKN